MQNVTRNGAQAATQQTQPSDIEYADVSKFRFDEPIQASDGYAGTFESLVVDPAQRVVTHVGVKPLGLFQSERFAPFERVPESKTDEVTLSISLAEIEQLPKQPPAGARIGGGAQVAANGRTVGRLRQVTVRRETGMLRALVVDRGLRGEAIIRAGAIEQVTSRQITVNLDGKGADTLTPYLHDNDLRDLIHATLYDYQPLRVDLPGIEIRVIDGVVWLRGNVSGDLNRRLATDLLSTNPYIATLYNELVADNELAAAVSYALMHEPSLENDHVGVYARLGDVSLRGAVRTAADKAAAGQLAEHVHGVRRVQNDLRVDPTAEVVPVLAGVTNEEDIVPGGR